MVMEFLDLSCICVTPTETTLDSYCIFNTLTIFFNNIMYQQELSSSYFLICTKISLGHSAPERRMGSCVCDIKD